MPDKTTLYTVTGVETWTLYAILKNARIFQPYFENKMKLALFFLMKGPADDVTDAPQPKAFLCNPVMMKMSSFFTKFLQLMEHQWTEIDREKPTTRIKTCPSDTLSTTNLTWT
jgi:hypothetical protein